MARAAIARAKTSNVAMKTSEMARKAGMAGTEASAKGLRVPTIR